MSNQSYLLSFYTLPFDTESFLLHTFCVKDKLNVQHKTPLFLVICNKIMLIQKKKHDFCKCQKFLTESKKLVINRISSGHNSTSQLFSMFITLVIMDYNIEWIIVSSSTS